MKKLNQIVKLHSCKLVVTMSMLLFAFVQSAVSIDITTAGAHTDRLSSSCVITGPVNEAITPLTLTTDVDGENWMVESISTYGGSSVPSLGSIGLSLHPDSGIISGTPNVADTFYVRISVADADPSNTDWTEEWIMICITRPPVEIMLVLDRSGSMSQSVPGASSMTKWEVMRESVKNFLIELEFYGADDKVGVVYFDDTRGDYLVGGARGLHTFVDETAIYTDIASFPASGWTCIGGGILAAYDAFVDADRYRHIIVLSDGMQNREPSYDQGTKEISDRDIDTDWTGATTTTYLNLQSPPSAKPFKIHTIAIGDNAVAALMQSIAAANSDTDLHGIHHHLSSTTNLYANLDAIFSQTFVATLANFSPAIVNKTVLETYTTATDYVNTSFNVNKSANKISIKVVGEAAELKGLEMNVIKDGISFSNFVDHDTYSLIFQADRHEIAALGTDVGGKWEVEFNGRKNVEFTVTCIINDEFINYETTMGDPEIEPGEPLNIKLSVDILGAPLTSLTEAKAIVLKPGQDLNDLFANADPNVDPIGEWNQEDGVNPGQAMYEKLVAFDTSFMNALIPVEHVHDLNNNGDGTYTYTFTDTKESGNYNAIFYFKGNTPEQGDFERFYQASRIVDFGQPDVDNTVLEVQQIDGTDSFVLTPKNKFGNLIGPNRLGQIQLLVNNDHVALTDNLDGSYTAKVKNPFFKPNPSVQILIKTTDYTQLAGISRYADIQGAEVSPFDWIRPWLILILLIIVIIYQRIRRS